GFLGAGAIIRQGIDVRGLTTAASLWAAAAIGMASGAGYYFGAAATTVIVVATLYLLRELRSRVISRFRTEFGVLNVTFETVRGEVRGVLEALDRHGMTVRNMETEIESGQARYSLQLRVPPDGNVQEMLGEVSELPGVRHVGMTGLHEAE
ncbi:MAG TPA: MgtC/SapB family protein, partial [Rubrobacteraceae bacterium]|nr:MgtC/SapB family protein [Rubrobacteraceae bacterium]